MITFLYVFLICIILIVVLVTFVVMFNGPTHDDNDNAYRDEKGRHSYYDRSIIEKDEFLKQHPNMKQDDLRSFKRLFKFLNKKR